MLEQHIWCQSKHSKMRHFAASWLVNLLERHRNEPKTSPRHHASSHIPNVSLRTQDDTWNLQNWGKIFTKCTLREVIMDSTWLTPYKLNQWHSDRPDGWFKATNQSIYLNGMSLPKKFQFCWDQQVMLGWPQPNNFCLWFKTMSWTSSKI